ncbi:hypothetical protein J4401_03155 [Candidatus Woesearchaeota archaeon]|nr:hypothetical protein [Candidatus Woesearchaeota archaeon]
MYPIGQSKMNRRAALKTIALAASSVFAFSAENVAGNSPLAQAIYHNAKAYWSEGKNENPIDIQPHLQGPEIDEKLHRISTAIDTIQAEDQRVSKGLDVVSACLRSYNNRGTPRTLIPDYEDTLDRIVLSCLGNFKGADVTATQRELINNLPEYTQIYVGTFPFLLDGKYKNGAEARFHSGGSAPTHWMQDFAEGDSQTKVIPLAMRTQSKAISHNGAISLFTYLCVKEIREIPIVYDGGNIFSARNRSKENVVIVGENSLFATNKRLFESLGFRYSVDEYKEVVSKTFGASQTVILCSEEGRIGRQSSFLYDLDVAMMPMNDGLIALLKVDEPPEKPKYSNEEASKMWEESRASYFNKLRTFTEKYGNLIIKPSNMPNEEWQMLQSLEADLKRWSREVDSVVDYERIQKINGSLNLYRSQLEKAGFSIISVPTSLDHMKYHASFVNGVPYRDKETNKQTFIMPIFPDNLGSNIDGKMDFSLTGMNGRAMKAIESYGINVIPVKDFGAFTLGGVLYCLTCR